MGFGGEVKVWGVKEGVWRAEGEVDTGARVVGAEGEGGNGNGKKAGEVWAVALSAEGQYLVATTQDGRVGVWDLDAKTEAEVSSGKGKISGVKIREMSTKGSFGMCVDLVCLLSLSPSHPHRSNTPSPSTAASPPLATKVATSISSATTPPACCTPSRGSSNPSAPWHSAPAGNSSPPRVTPASSASTTTRRASRSRTSRGMMPGSRV